MSEVFNFDELHEAIALEHPELLTDIDGERYALYAVEHRNGSDVTVTILAPEPTAHETDPEIVREDQLNEGVSDVRAAATLDVAALLTKHRADVRDPRLEAEAEAQKADGTR